MYHIKSDRRSQASAAEIVRGLQECLMREPKNLSTSDAAMQTIGVQIFGSCCYGAGRSRLGRAFC